jgi:hypothetical protein
MTDDPFPDLAQWAIVTPSGPATLILPPGVVVPRDCGVEIVPIEDRPGAGTVMIVPVPK